MHPPHHRGGPHVTELVNEQVSALAPFSGLILTISLVIFFLVRYYVFEKFLLIKCYGQTYLKLNENQRRGFINHHIAATAKIIMLVSAAYPFFAVIAGPATIHSSFAGSRLVKLGDVLLVLNQVFIAMYLFELIFRTELSYVAVAHHIGSVIIAASAVAISLNWQHERDATIEFMLCYVWGMFDVIAELWPHITIILYRMYPQNHHFLRIIFRSACIVTFCGTVTESGVVLWLFFSLWSRWSIPFRVVTPILHAVFSAAQLWGAWKFWGMWQREQRLLKEETPDVEALAVQPKSSS
ncbi:hypothetical protein T440DRAFT_500447 [Plenodomus tracheiphilus IPT5]|uniref:TLC domain-containing protein n=1 Tax=Plenodomus tracheiphilus IPT5 TaxID=1408161 RepID=A0A6A7AZL8_9PLEO|nr:hypothetical protein T440DRAFT_500447 [Plenodomus tracheiphilus IPT5]